MPFIIKVGTHWYKAAKIKNEYILHPAFLAATRFLTVEIAREEINKMQFQDAKLYQIVPQEVAVK